MRIQLESIEEFEEIFKQLLEAGPGSAPGAHEGEVIAHIKDLFSRNVEVNGMELDLDSALRDRLNRKKVDVNLIGQLEELEQERTLLLKELCELRRASPEALCRELEENHREVLAQIAKRPSTPPDPPEEHGAAGVLDECTSIGKAVCEIKRRIPEVIGKIEESASLIEDEIKESRSRSKRLEAQSLALLFKDDLEIA